MTPGLGEIGLICTSGMVPIGYYKDASKSAATFKVINGVRYSMPGDYATLNEDVTINLLGRGSNGINGGGEKIYPEEVEEAIKTYRAVVDCLVVGVPDDRFGDAVAAVFSIEGNIAVTTSAIKAHVRSALADDKAPRHCIQVEYVPRAVNGKADYKQTKILGLAVI